MKETIQQYFEKHRSLSIHGHKLELPLIQGGMGVGVSLGRLAGSVAKEGAMGCISTADCGFREPDFYKCPEEANLRALKKEIAAARALAGEKGLVAINAMVATRQYLEAVRTAVAAGIDAVISGAGLPLELPSVVPEGSALLAPIVSGARSARVLLKSWYRHFSRIPDFIVIEGPKAGGHLGFSEEVLKEEPLPELDALLREVSEETKPFEELAGREIPLYCAGGVYDSGDILRLMEEGAAGVQMATRFIATEECDASNSYKSFLLSASQEELRILKSPVGMPGRAIANPFLKTYQESGRIQPKHCSRCIKSCDPATVPYCITEALIEAVNGNVERGLFFSGANVGRVREMTTVPKLVHELLG